jgi:hypothetical protein
VKSELDVAERHLRELLEATKLLAIGVGHFQRSLAGYSQAMHQLHEGEREIDTLNDLTPEPTNSVPGLSSSTAEFMTGERAQTQIGEGRHVDVYMISCDLRLLRLQHGV